ncbi:MAG: ParB/RepB/Spo0J family partition protein [Candidatus Binataceae bacterium]
MTRKPLGRGLDALIRGGTGAAATEAVANGHAAAKDPETAAGAAIPREGRFAMVPADRIERGKYQPRLNFNEAALEELKKAIQEQGIVEPLIVRRIESPAGGEGPRYELIAGERRLRAARAAGMTAVPAIVREMDDRAALEMSLVENIMRESLSPIEEGIAFRRLAKNFALSHDQIAERIGKSRPYVTNQLRLLELPQEIIELVAGGKLTGGQGRALLMLKTRDQQMVAAARMLERGEPVRKTERTARTRAERAARRELPEGSATDPNALALAESLQRALKRKVRILRRRGRAPGRIEIDYYNDDDLTALADTILGHTRPGHAPA